MTDIFAIIYYYSTRYLYYIVFIVYTFEDNYFWFKYTSLYSLG